MIIPPPPEPRRKRVLFDPAWKLINDTKKWDNLDNGYNISATIPDDFANSESPKLKFNYTIQFGFRGDDPDNGSTVLKHNGAEDPYLNMLPVLKVTRPQPTINYTPANFYNFRTQVATKIDYGTVNVVFYDDSSNRAHDIFDKYFSTLSPVFGFNDDKRANTMDLYGIQELPVATGISGGGGSDVLPILPGADVTAKNKHTASIGDMAARHGLIKYLRIFHQYFNKDVSNNNPSARKTTVYTYFNPKIMTANLEELDMSQSAVTMIDFTFTYDSVFVEHFPKAPDETG